MADNRTQREAALRAAAWREGWFWMWAGLAVVVWLVVLAVIGG